MLCQIGRLKMACGNFVKNRAVYKPVNLLIFIVNRIYQSFNLIYIKLCK